MRRTYAIQRRHEKRKAFRDVGGVGMDVLRSLQRRFNKNDREDVSFVFQYFLIAPEVNENNVPGVLLL